MEDLLQCFRTVRRSQPFRADPHDRGRPVRPCETLARQAGAARRAVDLVRAGHRRNALTWEPTPHGIALYLWEHTPPEGFTYRGLEIPLAVVASIEGTPAAWRGKRVVMLAAVTLAVCASLLVLGFWLGRTL